MNRPALYQSNSHPRLENWHDGDDRTPLQGAAWWTHLDSKQGPLACELWNRPFPEYGSASLSIARYSPIPRWAQGPRGSRTPSAWMSVDTVAYADSQQKSRQSTRPTDARSFARPPSTLGFAEVTNPRALGGRNLDWRSLRPCRV